MRFSFLVKALIKHNYNIQSITSATVKVIKCFRNLTFHPAYGSAYLNEIAKKQFCNEPNRKKNK